MLNTNTTFIEVVLDNRATRGAHCRSENPQRGKGESERGVVCAQRVSLVGAQSKAKPQAKSWTIQSSVLVDEEGADNAFWGIGQCRQL